MPRQLELLELSRWANNRVRNEIGMLAENQPNDFHSIQQKFRALGLQIPESDEHLPTAPCLSDALDKLQAQQITTSLISKAIATFASKLAKQKIIYGVCADMASMAAWQLTNYHPLEPFTQICLASWSFYKTVNFSDETFEYKFGEQMTLILNNRFQQPDGCWLFNPRTELPQCVFFNPESAICDPWINQSHPLLGNLNDYFEKVLEVESPGIFPDRVFLKVVPLDNTILRSSG